MQRIALYFLLLTDLYIKCYNSFLRYVLETIQCQEGTTFHCTNGRTTRCSYRCDGDNDCGDNSDEEPRVCPKSKSTRTRSSTKKVRRSKILQDIFILTLTNYVDFKALFVIFCSIILTRKAS